MKVVLNEVSEKESDPCSGTQTKHLYKQCGKGLCKIYRKCQLSEQMLAPTLALYIALHCWLDRAVKERY